MFATNTGKRIMLAAYLCLAMPLLVGQAHSQDTDSREAPERSYEYSASLLETFEHIPVQHGGRVKPMGTLASFKLLKFNGKRKLASTGFALEETLSPQAWLLDCFFFPEQAKRYECFVIDHKAVPVALGLDIAEKKKRDRYSYNELLPIRENLFRKTSLAFAKEDSDRSELEKEIIVLWGKFSEFEDLCRLTTFAGSPIPTADVSFITDIFQGRNPELPEFLAQSPAVAQRLTGQENGAAWEAMEDHVDALARRNFDPLGIFPPGDSLEDGQAWLAWPEMITSCLRGDTLAMESLPLLESLGAAAKSKLNETEFEERIGQFSGMIQARTTPRGEDKRIGMEVTFFKRDFFFRALYAFVIGFLMVALSWLGPAASSARGWFVRIGWVTTVLGLVLLSVGITYRCVIRQRPPISTLYETILFIAATAVICGLFLEWINRRRIGLGLAAFLGAFGMFLAHRYELREANTSASGDTMPSLQAVLDTNYWLATHVTIINIGYAAGLLAAALGHVWLFSYFFGKGRKDKTVLSDITRMTYGVLCFSLLFSVVGTILGGVWANDSWGRFWGWDPKENGALMICLWQLLILHARMGGWIKQFGMANMNILLGMVVTFSWWGVNMLNTGLHTYGFIKGIGFWITVFYCIELTIVSLALLGKFYLDNKKSGANPAGETA